MKGRNIKTDVTAAEAASVPLQERRRIMYRFKNSLIAFVGLTALIGIIAAVTPNISRGQAPDPRPGATQPVREQNLDAGGAIRVHEQGTANVNVTNESLAVQVGNSSLDVNVQGGSVDANITGGSVQTTVPPATVAHCDIVGGDPESEHDLSFPTINATAIRAHSSNDSEVLIGFKSPLSNLSLVILGNTHFAALGKGEMTTFTHPVPINGAHITCSNSSSSCLVSFCVVGHAAQ